MKGQDYGRLWVGNGEDLECIRRGSGASEGYGKSQVNYSF